MAVKPDCLIEGVGQSVQKKRYELGLSQEELAQRAGLHRTYVSDIERGARRNVSLKTVTCLAHALGLPAWQLIFIAEEKSELLPVYAST